jgi:hypothetical protein
MIRPTVCHKWVKLTRNDLKRYPAEMIKALPALEKLTAKLKSLRRRKRLFKF